MICASGAASNGKNFDKQGSLPSKSPSPMKLIFTLALAALLSSCAPLSPNTTIGGRQATGADSFAPYGGQDDVGNGGSVFGSLKNSEDPNAEFVKRSRARYGTLFLAETKPWMVGSVQEQYPRKYALPGSGWKGAAPQTPVMDSYSMGSGGRASATK
jgi:hypothetical protein